MFYRHNFDEILPVPATEVAELIDASTRGLRVKSEVISFRDLVAVSIHVRDDERFIATFDMKDVVTVSLISELPIALYTPFIFLRSQQYSPQSKMIGYELDEHYEDYLLSIKTALLRLRQNKDEVEAFIKQCEAVAKISQLDLTLVRITS